LAELPDHPVGYLAKEMANDQITGDPANSISGATPVYFKD